MKAISELMLQKISKEDFLKQNNIVNIEEVIAKGLIAAYENKEAESVEVLLYLVFKFEVFNVEYVSIINKLLISDWHHQHENIVILLQKISCFESVDYLNSAIELHPQYLSWDDNYAFEIKCVRAIYHIGKEKSFSYLEKLCKHENSIIREMAQRQIKKLE